jgi:hypothetical protein
MAVRFENCQGEPAPLRSMEASLRSLHLSTRRPSRSCSPLWSPRGKAGQGEPGGIEREAAARSVPLTRGSHRDDDLRRRGSSCRVPHLCARCPGRATALFHAALLLLPARAGAQQRAWCTAAFASLAVLALVAASLGSTILGTSVAAHVVEAAQSIELRDFADGHAQLARASRRTDRPAKLLPTRLPRRGSRGIAKDGKHRDNAQ